MRYGSMVYYLTSSPIVLGPSTDACCTNNVRQSFGCLCHEWVWVQDAPLIVIVQLWACWRYKVSVHTDKAVIHVDKYLRDRFQGSINLDHTHDQFSNHYGSCCL